MWAKFATRTPLRSPFDISTYRAYLSNGAAVRGKYIYSQNDRAVDFQSDEVLHVIAVEL